jgi:hypothetical protein
METYGLNVGEDNRRGISWHAHKQALVSGVAERMHDPVHTLTPLCDGLTAHLVESDV